MNGMTARRLRVVLAILMLLIITAAIVGFSIVQKNLADYANSISKLNADAQSGDQDIRTLQNVKARLEKQQELVQKTRSVVGDASTYADKVINDITRIGSESGVTLTSIDFAAETQTTTATPAVPTTGVPATTAPTTTPASVSKKVVSISVDSPLSYTNLMKFLSKIESNSLRMHITKVTMTKDKDNMVATQDLSIEVYVRQ